MLPGKAFLAESKCDVVLEVWSRLEEFILHEIANVLVNDISPQDGFVAELYQKVVCSEDGNLLKLKIKSSVSVNKK